ncbi:ATP-binding response regulator [Asticcacaulis taihuensis]|uniref:histidine kinase n=1 Tax=Asticcacaulis taihuensis TaxID=260084 RepID=A0A1G4QC06_9CAUL|nr:HAMP domain-containing sensor histidine kinase [Asticcacaulis taihuensis]SCW41985.1 Signal transduction histidine kinase [Asticcacaulis taihuensis]
MNAFNPNLSRTPAPLPRGASRDSVVLDYGLIAQWRLAPYALGFFGMGLPLFLWTTQVALPVWLTGLFMLLFIINWTVFMIMKGQTARRMTPVPVPDAAIRRALIRERLWRQWLAGGLWTLTLLAISLSIGAGPHTATLLLLCAGAAVGIIFFSAPVLLFLLTLGPLAAAGPVFALYHLDSSGTLAQPMIGGMALALAMAFILNRHMQEHYLLENAQLDAALEREAIRADTEALNEARVALMETLSREVQSGLKGVEQNLLQGLTHLTRAPAPRQYVDAALAEITHLQTILVTTLDNDTAAAGQIEIDLQPLDIELLAERLMAQFADLARTRGLAITCNMQGLPTEGAVRGDEHRVEQILAHLLSNALLYTQQGRVELKLLHLPEGYLRIEVVDSGPGLSEDELALAFAPHSRILRTSSGHSGAGLGLSLSRSLSELMGGRTGAESTLDVGSKFWLDLPFDRHAKAPPRPAEPEVDETAPDHSLRILLIANDSLRAAQLRDVLEHQGHKCLTSTTRERALTLARKAPVDACLISTGPFEALEDAANREKLAAWLESLRATQADAHLNIIALLPDGLQAEALSELGVRALLMPLNREALVRALA